MKTEVYRRRASTAKDEREQERIRERAGKFAGAIAGDDPYRAERARRLVRRKLRAGRARR
jgi:hypothetical protein